MERKKRLLPSVRTFVLVSANHSLSPSHKVGTCLSLKIVQSILIHDVLADADCLLWEAYYTQGTGRCATFSTNYDASDLICPDSQFPYPIGYSVGAQKQS